VFASSWSWFWSLKYTYCSLSHFATTYSQSIFVLFYIFWPSNQATFVEARIETWHSRMSIVHLAMESGLHQPRPVARTILPFGNHRQLQCRQAKW
jgi:hypothetical protein